MKKTSLLVLALAFATTAIEAKDKKPKGGDQPYDAQAVVKKFDKNGDGKLSLEEYSAMAKWKKESDPAAAAKKSFEEIDTNHDNSVTAEELKAAHEKKEAKGKTEAPAKKETPADPNKK